MARPKVDSRLQNIEKMEEKIESDIAEIKEAVTEIKNGNNSTSGATAQAGKNQKDEPNKVDCLNEKCKEELTQSAS